jgi:hypothetical protein
MKILFENWRQFVAEETNIEDTALAEWQEILYQVAAEQGLIKNGGQLSEADIDDISDEPSVDDGTQDTKKKDKYKITQQINLPNRGTPESPYCIHTPEISEWALSTPERLAETILFVFASMQTPWNKLIPYFRSVMYIIEYSSETGQMDLPSEYVFKPARTLDASDAYYEAYLVMMDKLKKGILIYDGKEYSEDKKHKDYYSFSKTKYEDDEKYRPAIDKKINYLRTPENEERHAKAKKAYKELEDINNAKRKKILSRAFKNREQIEELTPEQEEYISAGIGNIAGIMGTPGIQLYMPIWENRQQLFNKIQPLAKDVINNPDNTESLIQLFIVVLENVKGLALAKAGFFVQLITGKLGCIDSIWTKVLNATDPELAALVKKHTGGSIDRTPGKRPDTLYKRLRKKAEGYILLLKAFEERGVDSEDMWNAWVQQVAMQIKNPGKYSQGEVLYQLVRDGKTLLSGPVKYSYSNLSPYKIEHEAYVDALNGLPIDHKLEKELGFISDFYVSYHHLPGRINIPSQVQKRGVASSFKENKKTKITKARLKEIIKEELTNQDKTDVKKMVQDELEKLLKKKDTKDQMGEIVKKIMKKLYKDLSLEHPYIIDRIKL